MSLIVIDTSAVIAVILDEPERSALVGLTEDTELAAPGCILWEVANAFSAMFRRKCLNLKDALMAMNSFESIPIQLLEVKMDNVLKYCSRYNMYACDAFYLDCAKRQKAPLLTLDRRLREIAREENIRVLPEV